MIFYTAVRVLARIEALRGVTDLDFGSIDRYIVARGVLRVSTGASRRFMHQNSSAFDPRKCLKEATKAMSENCVARHEAFGTAGNAFNCLLYTSPSPRDS